MYLSIIIPCYNEELRIGKTLEAVGSYLEHQSYDYEIIVVDNGSKDTTANIVSNHQKKMPALKLIHRQNFGKGWAVKQGMLEATGDFKLFMDADNSTDIREVEKLLAYAATDFEVVISSRKIEGALLAHPQPWHRAILGNIFVLIVRIIIPLRGIKDTQNGFKLFTKKAADILFPLQTLYYWSFDVELLALAQRHGLNIKEVPITWNNDERSKMRPMGMLRMAREILQLRLRLWLTR